VSLWTRLAGLVERRSAAGFTYAEPGGWFGAHGLGGHVPSPAAAENLSAIQACIGVISGSIASLPAHVFSTIGDTRTKVTAGPWPALIGNPWATLTWSEYIEWSLSQVLLSGNSYSEIIHNQAGVITALRPLPHERVTPLRLLNDPAAGRLVFNVSMPNEPMRQLLDSQVLHIRDRSDDGYLGRSRISRSPGVVLNAIALAEYNLHSWENGVTASGLVELSRKMSPEGFKRLKAQFEEKQTGTKNARRVVFVDDETKFTPLSANPVDAQVLDSRRFTTEEICRLYNVNPVIIHDMTRSNFNNATTAGLWLSQLTLLPWIRRIEAAFRLSVFGMNSGYELELDLSGMTRGDFATRWAAYTAAKTAGILTSDDIRLAEGLPRLAADDPTGSEPPDGNVT